MDSLGIHWMSGFFSYKKIDDKENVTEIVGFPWKEVLNDFVPNVMDT